jgi:pectin methylesterase-like acyl-CoA thioesterase
MAKNITFQNTFDYLADTAHSEKAALAMLVKGDKAVFTDCVFLSYQDTLQAKSGRQYYKNCTIKGSVDFIFGNNPAALFEDCDIVTLKTNNSNGGYVTAMKGNAGTNGQKVATYGIVFKNCRLTAEEGVAAHSVALGRPWRADATVAYINCEMGEHIGLNACGESNSRYTSMSGGGLNYPKDAHYAEYGNTGDGAVTEATDDFTMLTAEQAALYTMENIFATTNGDVTYSGEFDAASALSVLQAIEFPA